MRERVKIRLVGDGWDRGTFGVTEGDVVYATGPDSDGDYIISSGPAEDWYVFCDPENSASIRGQVGTRTGDILDTVTEITEVHDAVTAPSHYFRGGYELHDVIEAWDLDKDAYKKEAVCYIMRSAFKGAERQDIEKAVRLLNRWLARNKEDA